MGRPLPEKLAHVPELWPGLGLFYHAFLDLQTTRAVGWDEGPIPWTAIDRYADTHGLDEEQRDDLHYHVRTLDRAYLEWRRDEAKKKAPKPKEPKKGKGNERWATSESLRDG